MTEYATVTHVGEKHISRGQLRPRLQGRAKRPETFLRSLTDAQTVCPTATKYGKVTHVRCGVFLWVCYSVLQNFGDLYVRRNNQILHGDQTKGEENFYMVDHEC